MKRTTTLERTLKLMTIILLSISLGPLGCDTGDEDDVAEEKEKEKEEKEKEKEEEEEENDTDTDDTDPEVSKAPYTTALVVTTDYSSGAYATIKLGDLDKVEKDINSIHSDSVCHFDPMTDTPFILQRLGADSVLELNGEDFAIEKEFSVEANSNPHGMALVSEDRAYISRYGDPEMWVVNPFEGTELDTIDFSKYADDDGIPEVSGLVKLNDKVYATVERLDRDNSWEAVGGGVIVVMDAETGDIEKEVELTSSRSYGAPIYSEAVERFVIAETGSFGDLENAGIEYFDPKNNTVSDYIITEEELGGNVTKGVVLSEEKGYALIGVSGEAGSDTHVVSFNPETGKKLDTILQTEGWNYGDIALTPDGKELWVADRTAESDGIRIIDTETDKETTDEPISVGLPPSNICFTR